MEEEALGLTPAGSPRAAQCPPPGAGPTLPLSRFPQAGSADPRRLPSLPLASVFQGISLGCPSVPHKCTCACFSCGLWNPDPAFSPTASPGLLGFFLHIPDAWSLCSCFLKCDRGNRGSCTRSRCEICRPCGPLPKLLNQNLHFNKTSGGLSSGSHQRLQDTGQVNTVPATVTGTSVAALSAEGMCFLRSLQSMQHLQGCFCTQQPLCPGRC